jgi:3-oxoacyl-[acyl-carrier-protein] synthase III
MCYNCTALLYGGNKVAKARIIGAGYYLPKRILTNQDLEKMVDTSDEWITKRTGIKERHIAEATESSSDMGIKAAKKALEDAKISPLEIDGIICSTVTPDHSFPSNACLIQNSLGAKNAFAFDLSAACSGFIYALSVAESLLMQDKVKNVLVVACEKMSSITNWEDRSTCVLFGDASGAVVLHKEEGNNGILSSYLGADGSLGDLLILKAGGSRKPASMETVANKEHYLTMDGNEVFKVAVYRMIEAGSKALEKSGLKPENINLIIPHQANLRIIEAIAKRLDISREKVFVNLHETGNTSAATIAVGLAQAKEKKLIKENDIIVLTSFGAGFTWAGMVIRW